MKQNVFFVGERPILDIMNIPGTRNHILTKSITVLCATLLFLYQGKIAQSFMKTYIKTEIGYLDIAGIGGMQGL
ncbi:MAG: hypothetical protein A2V50_07400 [Bacteroidetes bacterium RBG_19FT_COMBO_42_10]|nr:MAG: hypothetical protein A2V50_07400 [Bacteroidetes bacterium RBG_19FT_COMBO_42_10]OFY63555.1 MAG: hypothetical protein A2V64_05835 [Bacteroidetes bacterium RBG_13_43_22]